MRTIEGACAPSEVNEGFLMRVKRHYAEMPGLSLTPAQAARLWTVDPATAGNALRVLSEHGYLRRRFDGAYSLTEGGLRTCAWFVDRC
jgi:DNA-binding MarR family transcriptional regulator